MMMRRARRGGPGIVGTMARTAVIAGTATAVAKGVSGSMDRHAEEQAQQEYAQQAAIDNQAQMQQMQQQMAAMQAQQAQQAMGPAAGGGGGGGGDDMMAKLQQLASLHDSGVLNDDEFAAAKAKLLG
jgi:TRAP-type uncharacterized transport system substrate-binding protein